MSLSCSPRPCRPGSCTQLTRKRESSSRKWNQIFLLGCESFPQKEKKLILKVNFPNLTSQTEQL